MEGTRNVGKEQRGTEENLPPLLCLTFPYFWSRPSRKLLKIPN
ncbi:hypothetical protein GXM_06366 [Nostoc sphaeroides CCNUC1]|uniref:Uncharacterized protein n=1 Tax=Nostoc sphaeroides CCNUC1 TaxID=2653204 RepID=A0A5P8W8G3_9NOSO|nr:hypothetical protein GXM_06366 [Nostoc sphaeroides CCNUC1]